VRVIAGIYKGRRLKAPAWDGLRPTSDKLRETLFNILAPRLSGARVVDVYAGTGALGIEALSRGADKVTFIERDRRAQALIEDNLAHCGITTSYTIIRTDALRALGMPGGRASSEPADIILLDPPYEESESEVAGVLAAAGERVAAGGVAVLEHPRRRAAPETAGRLGRTREVVSGNSALAFYEIKD
jgi:16S rRNA (guanine(966)-N(2))-methyltransferase RsmD